MSPKTTAFTQISLCQDQARTVYNTYPSLAFNGQQSLGVVWSKDYSTLAANWFDATWGYPVQTEQTVNDMVGTGSLYSAGIAGGENGETLITWQVYDSATYQGHVYGRRYSGNGMYVDDGSQLDVFGGIAYAGAYGDNPSTAFGLYDGGYVTVWLGDEGQGPGIYGQAFAADGAASSSPALLTDASVQSMYGASVAIGSDGWTYAVAYEGYDTITYESEIYVEVFNVDGSSINGMPTIVSQYDTTPSGRPAIVSDSYGYAAVWTAYDATWTSNHVYVRRLDSMGYAWSDPVQVDEGADGQCSIAHSGPAAAADGMGNLVVTWRDSGDWSGTPQLFARVFDAMPMPVTGETLIAEARSYSGGGPTVAMDRATGNFVVAWDNVSADWTAADVYVQRYNATAVSLGDPQQVNTAGGVNHSPAVAIDGEQRIGVTWTSQDANWNTTILARWFDAAGQPATDEVLVNAAEGAGYSSTSGAIAAGGGGEFIVAWSAYDAATSYNQVYQRQYSLETIDVFTEITVSQNTAPVVIDLRQYFGGDESLTCTLEGNDNESLTIGSIDGWLLTLDVTADLTGMAGLTIRGTDGGGQFSDVLLTLTVDASA